MAGLKITNVIAYQKLVNEVIALLGEARTRMAEQNNRSTWNQARREAADYLLS
jgi:hypothetical protein